MLKKKTRILVTHAIDFLHLSDRIIVLKEGKIQAFGTFEELEDDPHMKGVLEINKKNMEESKGHISENNSALLGTQSPINLRQSTNSKGPSLLLSADDSSDRGTMRGGVNNSTFIRDS